MTITTDPEAPEQPPAPAPRRRWIFVAGAVALVVIIAAVVWWRSGDDSNPSGLPQVDPGATVTVPAPVSEQLDVEGQELAALLTKGRTLTFHATYKSENDPATTDDDLVVEVWRKDGNIRQDSHSTSGVGAADTAGFVVDGKSTTCSKVGSEDWSCSVQPDAGTDLDGIFGSAKSQLAGLDVSVSDATVAGRAARCFAFPQTDGTGVVCATPDGMPLQLKINDLDLTLQDESPDVDGSVFTPPAAPTSS